jgi:hypothetical protein
LNTSDHSLLCQYFSENAASNLAIGCSVHAVQRSFGNSGNDTFNIIGISNGKGTHGHSILVGHGNVSHSGAF